MTEQDVSDILTTLDAVKELEGTLTDHYLRRLDAVSDILARHFGPWEEIEGLVEAELSAEERARRLLGTG